MKLHLKLEHLFFDPDGNETRAFWTTGPYKGYYRNGHIRGTFNNRICPAYDAMFNKVVTTLG